MVELRQRFPESIEWKDRVGMSALVEDVWKRLSNDLQDYGWDVDPSSIYFDAWAQGKENGWLDDRYWAFRIDHSERKPMVVLVEMDWDADWDGKSDVDNSRVKAIEVKR